MGECKKCGKCCRLRVKGHGMLLETGERCEHLKDDNLCAVYENRPPWCLSAKRMKELDILPQGCGYRGGV